jgi:integrase
VDTPLYRVRKMKDPKKRDKEKWFPLLPELAEILFRQPVKEGDSRFFPYNAKSVGAKYTKAKNALGIEGLHLHDSRRAGATDRLKTMTPNQVRHYFTGHETTAMLERVYDATNPAGAHALLRAP